MKRTAALLLALLAMAGPAQALTVSMKVLPLITEAQILAQAKNWKAALTKLDEADGVRSLPDDATAISRLRQSFKDAASHQAQP